MTARPVAVITGAGGDIGQAIARSFAADHIIAAADISFEAAEAVATGLRAEGGTAKALQCDITNPDSVAAMADAARALGPVRVLVNNAGGAIDLSVQSLTAEHLSADIALNLTGAVLCFKALESDLKQGGNVVNIASVNGLGVYGHPAYSAAKAGLIQFTRSLAVEYGRFGMRANAVAPGTVRTRAWNARALKNQQVFEEAKRWYPLARIATPEDVAAAVHFLAGPAASAITGVCLPVDCGLTAGTALLPATFTQSPDYLSENNK